MRDERRETKDKRQKTRDERQEMRDERRETRDERLKPDIFAPTASLLKWYWQDFDATGGPREAAELKHYRRGPPRPLDLRSSSQP